MSQDHNEIREPKCEKCNLSIEEKDQEAIAILAKLVAQEFSGVHYSCIGEVEEIDMIIAREAHAMISKTVDKVVDTNNYGEDIY